MTKEDAIAFINKIAADVLGGNGSGRHKNRLLLYYPPKDAKGRKYAFGYTPWKALDPQTGKTGYFALKYQILKDGTMKLVKSMRFGRRKIAKKHALQWRNRRYGGK